MSSLGQLQSETLADQAYSALRGAIVTGELAAGEKITERGLAERLQVSPTPIREALRRLEQDRLVERLGPRSLRVASLDDADLAEVSAIEDTLRGLAARMAAANATREQLDAIEAELDAADALIARVAAQERPSRRAVAVAAEQVFGHARTFHRMLDEASNSDLLLHLLKTVEAFDANQRRAEMRRELAAGNVDARNTRVREHRRIFEAVASRDEELAERLMLKHCREHTAAR